MKTIAEIKKGCGRMFVKNGFEMFCCKTDFVEHLCPTCQALLEQSQQFQKMIEEHKRKGFSYYSQGWNDVLDELLKEVRGERKC
jgi:hypothetical protein